jgi:hypothetical protein
MTLNHHENLKSFITLLQFGTFFFFPSQCRRWSWNSSVGIVMDYGLDGPGIRVKFLASARHLSPS